MNTVENMMLVSTRTKVLSTSAEELIKRSRQSSLVERGIFDGLSTRARAVVYHHQENKILECMRSAFSERKNV